MSLGYFGALGGLMDGAIVLAKSFPWDTKYRYRYRYYGPGASSRGSAPDKNYVRDLIDEARQNGDASCAAEAIDGNTGIMFHATYGGGGKCDGVTQAYLDRLAPPKDHQASSKAAAPTSGTSGTVKLVAGVGILALLGLAFFQR